jgi:2-keto-4-pentenoate hydratase/2-oxohepta-3-ene-1,7-dioic acid hydratase in catechol pathway
MERLIRFTTSAGVPPTAPDGSPGVSYGLLEGESVRETGTFWSGEPGIVYPLAAVRLLPPCWPTKIVCVGRNYHEHASELGNPVPSEPLIFLKPPSSLLGHLGEIVYPQIAQRVDYEGEIGIVIGRRARHIRREDADRYILGYTCVNDVTARDLQKKDGQWTRGKGFDTFCPAGPWIVRRDDVAFDGLSVRTFVDNGKRQEGAAGEMIFSPDVVLEFVTQFMTLEPGDLVATGTPAGVGPLEPGSVVRVVVEGVGALENTVVAA